MTYASPEEVIEMLGRLSKLPFVSQINELSNLLDTAFESGRLAGQAEAQDDPEDRVHIPSSAEQQVTPTLPEWWGEAVAGAQGRYQGEIAGKHPDDISDHSWSVAAAIAAKGATVAEVQGLAKMVERAKRSPAR